MLRAVRFMLAAFALLVVGGCGTTEIKNLNDVGLVKGVPNGTLESGYGDGKGDSVGGGGAAPAISMKAPGEAGQ